MTKDFQPPSGIITSSPGAIADLGERAREIFRHIVESYVQTGEPVGSRTLSQKVSAQLSPASIRNVMADLEQLGLLYAPHASAGRLPTQAGLRLFVDAMLEVGNLSEEERRGIEARLAVRNSTLPDMLTHATAQLAGLSQCAGLVVSPKLDRALKHVEFVGVSPGKSLVVLVSDDGAVENRVIDTPIGLPPSALQEASNYLNARLRGRTIDEAKTAVIEELQSQRAELDTLTARLVHEGLVTWTGESRGERSLIVRGASSLLTDVSAGQDLERIRMLFDDIERREELVQLLDLVRDGDGVRIFIGSENKLFSLSGSSVVLAPYTDSRAKIVGVVGVIGPTRLNYARVIPMVDYTAKIIGRALS